MTWPKPILDALGKTSGTVFHRCALQVNPFDYVRRHRHQSSFTNEQDYNAAIVEACQQAGITVVGITDNHTVHSMRGLRASLTEVGITVFPGFEARTKDGVEALVLFEPSATERQLERRLGELGAACRRHEPGRVRRSVSKGPAGRD